MNVLVSRRSSGRGRPTRRSVIHAVLILALAGLSAGANAAECDTLAGETLRWIVPNSAGGGYDAYSRLLKPFFERRLNATIRVDNLLGAGGTVGAAAIRDATPDGRTIGIINATGLLAATVDRRTPNPATDFTILGRIVSNHPVLLTGADSGIDSLDDLMRLAAKRSIVIGVRDAGSASVFTVPVTAALLGIDYSLVTGYVGNSARALAAIRGEVDLLLQNFDSTRRFIEAGELRPLLQLASLTSAEPSGVDFGVLVHVPVLVGERGVAQQRALMAGNSRAEALMQAGALTALIDAGRLVAAPPALPEQLRRCLETVASDVLTSPELRAVAERAQLRIESADATQAREDIFIAAESMAVFAPMVRAAMQQARQ